MTESRTKNTKRNIIFSYLYTCSNFFFQFISRTIIIRFFSSEYLGISSLFTSILSVLNMADLGFSGAIVYNMYKPLAENDTEKVCALLNAYKKIYRVVGTVIFISGCIVTPFVPKLIKGSWPAELNIYLVFLLYLINTSVSYFLFAYKTSLLEAAQRSDIVKKVYFGVTIFQNAFQIVSLVVWHDYYLFVIVLILSTVAKNILVEIFSKKYYPQYLCKGKIDEIQKKDIISRVKGLLICNISGVTYSTFDSIILSAFIGLTSVGIYNNYIFIFTAASSIIALIRQAMQASVGNSIATETREKNYNDMLLWQFMFSLIASFCSTCLLCLFQPFMKIWAGKDMLLPFTDVVLLSVWFNIGTVQHSYFLYLSGNGLWWEMRWPYICSTVCNLLLNILLGKFFGTTGIIAASLIASLVFCLIWQSNITFKYYFKQSSKEFLLRQVGYFTATIPGAALSYYLCSLIRVNGIGGLIIKGIVCIIAIIAYLLVIYIKTPIFKQAKNFSMKVIKTDK